jgi:hypothetical protein
MADLADLILGQQRERFAPPPVAVKGEVAEIDGDDLYLVVPSYDPQLRFGPCPWIGPDDASAGDVCLVVFDDEREPWAIVPGTFTRS